MIHQEIEIKTNHATARLVTYIQDNTEEIDAYRKRPAVIICPGGGYEYTSAREAEPIALKMMSFGYQAFVLYYNVGTAKFPQALLELAKAVQIVRKNSENWHVDVTKIIVNGFSAGGHLVASLGVFWNQTFLEEALNGHPEEWKPNGLLLAYPVISGGEFAHESSFRSLAGERYEELVEYLSLEKQVTPATPPTFIWHTGEDGIVPIENSLLFAQSLRKNNVPFELHLFPKGGHGLSLATLETAAGGEYGIEETVTVWPELCRNWIDCL